MTPLLIPKSGGASKPDATTASPAVIAKTEMSKTEETLWSSRRSSGDGGVWWKIVASVPLHADD